MKKDTNHVCGPICHEPLTLHTVWRAVTDDDVTHILMLFKLGKNYIYTVGRKNPDNKFPNLLLPDTFDFIQEFMSSEKDEQAAIAQAEEFKSFWMLRNSPKFSEKVMGGPPRKFKLFQKIQINSDNRHVQDAATEWMETTPITNKDLWLGTLEAAEAKFLNKIGEK